MKYVASTLYVFGSFTSYSYYETMYGYRLDPLTMPMTMFDTCNLYNTYTNFYDSGGATNYISYWNNWSGSFFFITEP
jgi:hypothetical protein